MRSEGTVVGSVCLSLNISLPMFVRLTNDTIYLAGNEGQKVRAVLSESRSSGAFYACDYMEFVAKGEANSRSSCFILSSLLAICRTISPCARREMMSALS